MTACTRNGRACRGRRTTAHQTDTLGGCRSLQHWLVWLAVVGEWELLLPPLWRDDRSIRSARLGKGSRVYRGGVTGSPSQHGAYERGTPDRSAVPYAPARSGRACWDGVAAGRPAGAADLEASLRFVLFGGPCSAGTDLLHVLPPLCVWFAPRCVWTGAEDRPIMQTLVALPAGQKQDQSVTFLSWMTTVYDGLF